MTKTGLLHHVEIYVPELQQSIDFWGWFLPQLGYTEFQKWDEGISYKLGETYIVFVQTEERFLDNPYHRCHSGLNHLAFHADSIDFIENIRQQLKEKRIKILYEDRHPFAGGEDYYALFFEDPMRMKVELVYTEN